MAFEFFMTKENQAREHMRLYLEKTYGVQLPFKFNAYCLCYKGRICKFFYTLDEARTFLENPNHTPFEQLFALNGYKARQEKEETPATEEVTVEAPAVTEIAEDAKVVEDAADTKSEE